MRLWKSIQIIALLCFLLCLFGCGSTDQNAQAATDPAPTAPVETEDPRLQTTELQMVITNDNVAELDFYPNLKLLDATGSTCYAALEVYARAHPEVAVIYTVSLGPVEVTHGVTEITLSPEETDFEVLMTNLAFLKETKKLSLPKTSLSDEQLSMLCEAYPDLEVYYTLDILGAEYASDTTALDLSVIQPEQTAQVAAALARLPGLESVELMNSSGKSQLSMADVQVLVEAAPNAIFHYTFSLFGKTISTNDTTVQFKNLKLTAEHEPELRQALAIMTGCEAFILDNCGLDSELLAQIREDYPRTELVWRIYFGKYNTLTNAETIRAVYNVFDSTCSELRYCRKVKYMDIGHNEELTDLSFVGYMPDLEILIASGCAVKELTGFENCKKLEFLELAYCYKLENVEPLAGCENLKNLNICYSKVSNLQPLDGLPLERFSCKQTRVPASEQKIFQEIHPDCVTNFYGKDPYAGAGWRYVDNGKTYTEIYKKVREVFRYDDLPT